MTKDIGEEIRGTELFMLEQFIDVIDVLEKYETIEEVRKDVNRRKKIYMENIKKISENKDFLSLNLDNESIDDRIKRYRETDTKSEEYNNIHLAYKIGVIDGMKLKNRCT